MPSTVEKTRKQIAKKKHGTIEALHQDSRDSRRLHRAQVRDNRLEKIADARRKRDQPLLERVAFFRECVRDSGNMPLELEQVQAKIKEFVHQHDEEYETVKKARRPGRPASAKEDLLKLKMAALEKEHENGFYVPDLTTEANVQMLERWEGSWAYLTNVSWVRLSRSGNVKPSSFPPKGDH